MKQENRDCKIVQDLLPNYIEKLTDEVTNEYIEEHIESCSECANALKAMNGDIQIEEFDQDREINYLKGVRKRVKRTIAIVSLVVIIIAVGIVLYIHSQSQIQVNNYTFLRASYVKENQEETVDGKIYGSLIAMIDDEGICKSVRIVEDGYTDNVLKEKIKESQQNNDIKYTMNVTIKGKSLHYNINIYNGNSKEQLKDKLVSNYHIENIEEI